MHTIIERHKEAQVMISLRLARARRTPLPCCSLPHFILIILLLIPLPFPHLYHSLFKIALTLLSSSFHTHHIVRLIPLPFLHLCYSLFKLVLPCSLLHFILIISFVLFTSFSLTCHCCSDPHFILTIVELVISV